uniref:Pyruvate kinase n=1 Tax=Parascaris univalens TaxID=6257 RepID=A0A915B1C1_PARUN
MEQPATLIQHLCDLNIDDYSPIFRKTSIICTIGPATHDVETLKEMITTGMNIARLNFSHGSYEYHAETISNLREALLTLNDGRSIAIALDTKGPEIRTGVLSNGATAEVEVKKDSTVTLTIDPKYKDKCTEEKIYIDYRNITKAVCPGKRIFIDDGLICLCVTKVDDEEILCVVENGGMLGSRKGVNLPGSSVDLPPITEKDFADLQFGIQQNIDIVFASFARSAAGIREIRKALGEKGKHIKVIAKIENQQGVERADEIIAEADGIMVARGDLGIEIPPEQVFLVQKTLTAKCNRIGKPVICATQMLESMVHKPRPTRAEGSDVANAVLDGVDCVMLSGETAKGSYPIEALLMMHQICREAEATIVYSTYFEELLRVIEKPTDMAQTIAIAATSAVGSCRATGIVCVTNNGRAAMLLSHCRPPVPIYAVTTDVVVARQLHLYRGVFPLHYRGQTTGDALADLEKQLNFAISVGTGNGYIHSGDLLIIVTGANEVSGQTNALRIIRTP